MARRAAPRLDSGAPGETRSARRLQEVIDVAALLFARDGYEETSVQDVASAVGVLKGSLYYYIDTKEDLLFWVLRQNHERLRQYVVDEPDYRALEALSKIEVFVTRHVQYVLDNAAMSELYARKFATLAATPERQQDIRELRRAYEQVLVELISDAQDIGKANRQLNPMLVSRSLLASGNSAHSWFHPGGRFGEDEIVRHHAELALRAVALQ